MLHHSMHNNKSNTHTNGLSDFVAYLLFEEHGGRLIDVFDRLDFHEIYQESETS